MRGWAWMVLSKSKYLDLKSASAHKICLFCRGNAEEIVSSLQELEAMQEGTEELRERVLGGDGVLRKAGTTFVNGLEQLQDLQRVERQVEASCRVRFPLQYAFGDLSKEALLL